MQNCQRGTLDKAEGSCHYYKAAGHEVISFFAGMGHLLPMPPAQSPRWAPPRGPHDLSLPQPGLLESSGGEAEAHMGTLTRPTSLCLLWPAQLPCRVPCVYISSAGQAGCPEHMLSPLIVLPRRCTGQTDEFLDRRQLKFGLQCQNLMSQLVLCLNHKSSSLDTAETHNSVPHPGILRVSFPQCILLGPCFQTQCQCWQCADPYASAFPPQSRAKDSKYQMRNRIQ